MNAPKKYVSFFVILYLFLLGASSAYGQGLPIPIGVGGVGVGVPDIPTNVLTDYPIPYANKAADYRSVYLVRAVEFGGDSTSKAIRSIFFEVEKAQQAPLYNFTIRMRQTDEDSLTIPIKEDDLLTVYGPTTYVENKGFNEHRFDVPFCWDGVSNVVIDICVQNPAEDNSLNATVKGSVPDTTKNSSYHDWVNDGRSLCGPGGAVQPKLYNARPLMYFSHIGGDEVDLRAKQAPYPGSFMLLNSSQNIEFTFQNYGCVPVTNPVIAYKWNNNVEVTEQWPGTLLPGEIATHNFSVPVDAYDQGFNNLKVWTDGIGDVFRANDTIEKLVWVKDTTLEGLDYTGKEFWVAFMHNYDNGPSLKQKLFITSGNNTNVDVSFPLLGWSTTVSVLENEVVTVDIPTEVAGVITATEESEVVTKNGLLIESEKPVSVYGYSAVQYTSDGFLAVPERTLGTEYLVVAPAGIFNPNGELIGNTPLINAPAEFIVVGTTNNTSVTIIPSNPTYVSETKDTIRVTLQAGETFLVKAQIEKLLELSTGTVDLTGSEVYADKPIAVLSGAQCAMVPSQMDPNKCDACDHLIEQMTPVGTWGKEFYLTDFYYKPGKDIVRIMSSSSSNANITINNSINVSLPPKGEYYDYRFEGNVLIESDIPIQVAQFCTGANCEPTSLTDPFYTNIIPIEQWGNFYTFTTPVIPRFDLHYANVVKKGKTARVAVDSKNLDNSLFTQVSNTDLYAAKIKVRTGSHIITADSSVIVNIYGFGRAESYGYPSSGSFLRRINVDSVEVDIIPEAPSCNQTEDGSLKADVWYGSPPFTFLWSTGATTSQIDNVGEGTYWVKVTDRFGYVAYDTLELKAPDRLEVSGNATELLCHNDKNAMAWLDIEGGSKPYTITWFTIPPSNNDSLFNLESGVYKYRVVDKKGCEVLDSVVILNPDPIQVTVDITPINCYGYHTGEMVVSAEGGTGNLVINWPGESLTQVWSRTNMEAGVYFFEIKDENNCRVDSLIPLPSPKEITWSLKKINEDVCEKGIGTIKIEPNGGLAPYEVLWSNLETTWEINNLTKGNYYFTITDSNDCTFSDSVVLGGTSKPNISLVEIIPATCENGTGYGKVSVTGGDSTNYLIKWNALPPQYGLEAFNLDSGNILVSVNDLKCHDSLWVNIPFVAPPSVTFNVTEPTCGSTNGEVLATVTEGTSPYSYHWSSNPVQTSNPMTGVNAGSYISTITDANCTVVNQIDLLNVDGPQVSFNITNSNCNLDNGAVEALVSGGTGSYQYNWNGNGFQASNVLNNLAPGWHQVEVDDGNCLITLDFEIPETKPLNIFKKNVVNALCGTASGRIEVGVLHGSGTYSYAWSDTLLTSSTRENVVPGIYKVYVDDGLCTDSLQIEVEDYQSIQLRLVSKEDAICGQNANIICSGVGGTGNYTWIWPHDTTIHTYEAYQVPAGNNKIILKDGTCLDSMEVWIADDQNLDVNVYKNKNARCNLPNGSGNIVVIGGTGNYDVSWMGPDTAYTLLHNNLWPGKYYVSLIDGTCSWNDSIVIDNIPGPKLQLDRLYPERCDVVNGRAEVSLAEGTGDIWWDIAPIEYVPIIKNKPAGVYIAYASDGYCLDSLIVSIPYYEGPDAEIITYGASCDEFNGSAIIRPAGGTLPYSYLWRTFPVSYDTIATGLGAGNYVVELTDSVCTKEISFHIPNLGGPVVNPVEVNPATCELHNGSATVAAIGGSGNYTFTWETMPIQIGETAENLAPGEYLVVADDGFCADEIIVVVGERPKPIWSQEEITPAHCGEPNGEIILNPEELEYTVKWLMADSSTSWKLTDLEPGLYSYVLNNEWCSDTFMVEVEAYLLAELSINALPASCGKEDGSIIIHENEEFNGNSSIEWESGETTFGRSNLDSGLYVFTWKDEYCVIVDSVFIEYKSGPEIVLDSISHPECGWNDGYIRVRSLGGENTKEGRWLDGNWMTQERTNLLPGNYTYQVSDDYCTVDSLIKLRDNTPQLNYNAIGEFCSQQNGKIQVNITYGTAPFEITWNDGFGNHLTRDSVSSGLYIYSVTDAKGCAVEDQAFVGRINTEVPIYQVMHQIPLKAEEGDLLTLWAEYPSSWELVNAFTPEGDTIVEWPHKYQTYESGELPFELVYISENGCYDTLKVYIFVEDISNLYIPNAFSPDSKDNLNSVFKLYGSGLQSVVGEIYDRWGEVVKEFKSIDDFWDGTFKGKDCTPDVYTYRFYVTDINGRLKKAYGSVTLIR